MTPYEINCQFLCIYNKCFYLHKKEIDFNGQKLYIETEILRVSGQPVSENIFS